MFFAWRGANLLFLFGAKSFIGAKIDEFVKSHHGDDEVKSSRGKARKSLGMRRTYVYVAVTKDEVQRRIWTFYDVVKIEYLRRSEELRKERLKMDLPRPGQDNQERRDNDDGDKLA